MSNRIVADRIKVEPLGPAIGARVGGIDLGRPLDAASREKLGDALISHKVLFFEDQIITPQQQRNFAAAFGKLHIHPIYPQVEDVPDPSILMAGGKPLWQKPGPRPASLSVRGKSRLHP